MTVISNMQYEALRVALYKWGFDNKISIYEENNGSFAVNWAAFGNVTPEQAREYATTIEQARRIAAALNSLGLVKDYAIKEDGGREAYQNYINKYMAQFNAAR